MLKDISIGLITLIALYLGTGGFIMLQNEQMYAKAITLEKKEVKNNKTVFKNKETMSAAKQRDLIIGIYPHASQIPSTINFLLIAISFGIIGSIGKIINDSIQFKTNLKDTPNLLLVPVQGSIIGIIILGISYTIPIILINDSVSLKPITIVFLSLFGGVFYQNFYNWLTEIFNKKILKKSA